MFWVLLALSCLIAYKFLDRILRSFTVSDYEGKFVLITGCDSGFGKILALRLDKLGFHVFASCLTKDGETNLKKEGSKRIIPFHLNVCNFDSIQKSFELVKQTVSQKQGLWALVNNAGIGGELGPPDLNTVSGVKHTLDVNLYGPIEMCRIFLPLVRKSKGRIVNITSMCGRFPAADGPYCASKYGLEGYTDSLRREVYSEGIKVSILEPDYFRTDILKLEPSLNNVKTRMENASAEVKATYGSKFFERYSGIALQITGEAYPNLDPVINAYLHAITSRFPRTRYILGLKAKYLFIPLSYLPDWVGNFVYEMIVNLKTPNL